MNEAAATDDAALQSALAPFLSHGIVLLAVSGGPDSTALLHAAVRSGAGSAMHVATVDHRLRSASAEEAKLVADMAARFRLPHRVLCWERVARTGGLQAAAREARLRLLSGLAREIGAATILTAHTADDQAETVLMRLIAGSGPAGLCGMRRERRLDHGVSLIRPFLHLRKACLVAYCKRHGLPFVQDPSNHDERFGRARLRKAMPALASEGLTAERLCRLAERVTRDEAALAAGSEALWLRVARVSADGKLVLDGRHLCHEPEALLLRVMARALGAGQDHTAAPVRLGRLERLVLGRLLPALHAGVAARNTLAGRLIDVQPSGEIEFRTAPPRRGTIHRVPRADRDLLGKAESAAYIGIERVE